MFYSNIYAAFISLNQQEIYLDSKPSQFSQQSDWINVDSYIDYVGIIQQKYEDILSEDEITAENPCFELFDYVPDTDNVLIDSESLKDFLFIKSEADLKIRLKYNDRYGNPVSNGYPKFYYKKHDTSTFWTQIDCNNVANNEFVVTDFTSDYGIFEYYVVASNGNYPGQYSSPVKTFIVTERPHSFENLNKNLQDGKGNSNTVLNFSWKTEKGVESDVLKYVLFLGMSENSMKQYDLGMNNFYVAENLFPRSRYYWRVEVENQYGAKLLSPETFVFVTLGEIKRAYNAPNPFNPQKGEKTRIFFEMHEDGNADIDVYSEYGDKIFHAAVKNLSKGNNEFTYDGKDDYGNVLYNGTYLCVIKKKYSDNTKTERCRLLIIK